MNVAMAKRLATQILLGAWAFLPAQVTIADEQDRGFFALKKGRYEAAEKHFANALDSSGSSLETAKTLKLLGISQYMQGKRQAAARSIRRAKTIEPRLSLESAEILEPGILDFFNSIEAPRAPPTKKQRSRPEQKQKQKLPAPRQRDPSKAPQKPQRAEILVISNAVNGRVFISGRELGRVGDAIVVPPGLHEVTLKALGYRSQTLSVMAQAQKITELKFKLRRQKRRLKSRKTKSHRKAHHRRQREAKQLFAPQAKRGQVLAPREDLSPPLWAVFLPFGLPQFAHEERLLGTLFASSQGLCIGLGVYYWFDADRRVANSNAFVSERDAQSASIQDPVQKSRFDDETEAEFESQRDAIDFGRARAWQLFSIAGGLWVASSITAYFRHHSEKQTADRRLGQQRAFRQRELDWAWSPALSVKERRALALRLSLNF